MEKLESKKFYIIGNNLGLDFANSIMFELSTEDLLAWTIAAGLVEAVEVERLYPKWSKSSLDSISTFRRFLRKTVVKLTKHKEISQSDVEVVNKVLKQKSGYSELQKQTEGFAKGFRIDLEDPNAVLEPIAESFVDLLCYGNLNYLRKCESPECVLYFYDTTKNHRRRWCSMAVCGNRAKASSFYKRKKKQDLES